MPTDDRVRTPYVPPTGDAPLDAVEQALVRMWIDIIAAELRAELADRSKPDDEPDNVAS